jgi:beta-lactamase superfamily II metal-dependent hydrolase
MAVIHFLNVNGGDCSLIQHNTSRNTVIDVNNAKLETPEEKLEAAISKLAMFYDASVRKGTGNYNQKAYPVNPITYFKGLGISEVFRFILSHPDMDHMGGIKAFFSQFQVLNFWDTANTKDMETFDGSPYSEEDWNFYQSLRKGEKGIKVLNLHCGDNGTFWNQATSGSGDGLHILAPTPDLVKEANECEDFNDCSYVILYKTGDRKIVFAGDSHDKTWAHILAKDSAWVTNVDLLIAPHHGRKSGRSYEFLDVLNPQLTFFGNASSEHLAYDAWSSRGLRFITNNQANCMVVDIGDTMDVFVTNGTFAKDQNANTWYSERLKAWYLEPVAAAKKGRESNAALR